MQDQHKHIKGYRDLSPVEIDLMNRAKELGPQIEALTKEIRDHLLAQISAVNARIDELTVEPDDEPADVAEVRFAELQQQRDELNRLTAAEPMKWLYHGRTDLQVGLMKIVRSIAQPTA
jgi:hypothetical protein